MNTVLNNPFRTLGLLVGTKASEQSRQIKRLKQFTEAELDPDSDFSFPTLGSFVRTLDAIKDAESKINLDGDKMNSALFWFYNGNTITDEPAFDFIAVGKPEEAESIWTKLTATPVNERNCSAFQNLSTLLLGSAFNEIIINETRFEQGIVIKLQLLESEFVKNFVAIATDLTYKASKIEIQLLFLNQLKTEIEKDKKKSIDFFFKILNQQIFSAKEEFFKSFVEKPIKEIEKRIVETKTKCKSDKGKSAKFGDELFITAQNDLSQIKAVLGASNLKFITISDKVANEILQCSFIVFNHFHNTETEAGEIVLELINKAKSIAIGSIIKERINDNLPNIEDYIKRKPERERTNKIGKYVNSINLILKEFNNVNSFINNITKDSNRSIDNIKIDLLFTNKRFTFSEEYINKINILLSLLVKINLKIGKKDEFYLRLCSDVSDVVASNIVTVLNLSPHEIYEALNITDKLDLLPGNRGILSRKNPTTQNSYYFETRESLEKMAINRGIYNLSPATKAFMELTNQKKYLEQVKNQVFLKAEIEQANAILDNIKRWVIFRSQSQRELEIKEQEGKIKNLLIDSERDKEIAINKQEVKIKEAEISKQKIDNESKLFK